MTFEGDREARFEDPDFDPDAYLASVVDLGSKPPPESAPFAFAASARDAFAAARDRLGSHAAAAARRAADLAAVASAENDVFLSRVGDVATDAVTLEATLDALHERVDRVAVVARDAGEALRRAESRRVAADDAVRLARHLVAFDACRNRERLRFAVDPVFFDEARAAEAAPLARQLLTLATDTREAVVGAVANRSRARSRNPAHEPPDATAGRVSRDGANKNAFLANARDALEWYCDALEARLLRTFEDAERGGDDAAAMDAAAALETFGRGGSLARRFVATRPMFTRAASFAPTDSTVAPDGEDPSSGREKNVFSRFAAVAGARGARDAAARAASALRDAFESIKDDTVAETRRARALFPEGPAFERAVAALTRRVVEQSVGDAMDAALGAAPAPTPAFEPGKDETTFKERKERATGSQEVPLRNAGARSAPVSPLKPSAPRTRHRRAASVSVASTSRMGGAAADARDVRSRRSGSRTNGLVSFAMTDDTEDTQNTEARPDAPHSSLLSDHVRSESDGETSDETRSDEDASCRAVRDAPRAFALAAYLAALAEAHALARRLASDLRAETRGAVRVADALDALLAARRAGYDEMETACLRGLVAARADSAATDGDDGFFGEEETETADRKRDHSPDEKHVVAEARPAARERAVLLDIPRWFDAAAKRVDAVFAPPLASRDEESRREGTDAFVDAVVRRSSDASSEEGKKAISARAIATATSLASAAAAEHRIAEIAFTEMARVASATTKRASALCALRARRLPPATKEEAADDATRRAADAADACLGAACAAADAVAEAASAARDVAQARAAAAADRVASASGAMVGGGDVAASAAAAARATADAAARATASAAAKFESRAGAAASRCVSAALDVFFGVFGAEIKAKLCGKKIRDRYAFDFADAAAAAADPSFFPGQHASDACASALARLRRAAEALDSLASSRGAGRGAEETRAALMRELSSRALVAIKGHFFELGRFAYSAAGALQLKRDLGEFEAWAVSVSSNISNAHGRDARESEKLQDANDGSAVAAAFRDEIQKQWRDTLEACDVLLVSPDALPGLLKQRTAESANAFSGGDENAAENVALSPRRIVSLRVDFHPSMVEGLGPALAEKNDSGAARHARSGSLSSAFFASFGRTHSPPPTR